MRKKPKKLGKQWANWISVRQMPAPVAIIASDYLLPRSLDWLYHRWNGNSGDAIDEQVGICSPEIWFDPDIFGIFCSHSDIRKYTRKYMLLFIFTNKFKILRVIRCSCKNFPFFQPIIHMVKMKFALSISCSPFTIVWRLRKVAVLSHQPSNQ